MRKRRALRLLLALLLNLPLLFVAAVLLLFDWDDLREPLAARATARLGREVTISKPLQVDVDWPVSALVLRDVVIANLPEAREPALLQFARLRVSLDLRSLLGGDVVVPEVRVEAPTLNLEKNAQGRANWQLATGGDSGAQDRQDLPEIEHLLIDDGRVHYLDVQKDIDLDMQLARVEGSADDDARRITLDGRGSMRGQTLAFHLAGGNLDTLRERDRPYPVAGDLQAGATQAHFEGEVADPVQGSGLDLRLSVSGDSASSLYPLTGIALLPTSPYRVSGRLRYDDRLWRFQDFNGDMGDSDLHGWLRWDKHGAQPLLRARFTSERLAFADLGPLIGVSDEEKQAAGDADGRVLPDVPLDPARLAAMDADVEFHGKRVIATGLPMRDFSLRIELDSRVLRVAPVGFTSGAGTVEFYATVDGTRAPPRVDSRASVRALPLAPLFEAVAARLGEKNPASGNIDGDAELEGQGGSLRDMLATANGRVRLYSRDGTLSQVLIELVGLDIAEAAGFLLTGDEPVPLRCMLADFEAQDGTLRARALVIDTTDTLITGKGSIELGSERLDLTLSPAPKDFSPLTLRTPLSVEGSFADPAFGVEKSGLIARGVAAAALALAFPPAAIAALFEPGTGDDANCSVLLAQHPAEAASRAAESPGTK